MSTHDVSVIFVANEFPGYSCTNVQVLLSSSHHRERLTSQREAQIDHIWQDCLKGNPHLYDGSKFRYHSAVVRGDTVQLKLGLTSYKEFLGTNWAPDAKSLRAAGQEQYSNTQAFMSDPLGVGNFVETCDGHVIFIRRSQRVGEAQGLWDIPGGHPEPEEVSGGSSKLAQMDISALSPTDVLSEIFDSTLREVRDEVNIPFSNLSEPFLMGLAVNHTSAGRPSAEFYVRCSLNKAEVLQLYKVGGAEAEESSNITFVPVKDISKIEESDMWKEMAPSAKGCMLLYNTLHTNSTGSPPMVPKSGDG